MSTALASAADGLKVVIIDTANGISPKRLLDLLLLKSENTSFPDPEQKQHYLSRVLSFITIKRFFDIWQTIDYLCELQMTMANGADCDLLVIDCIHHLIAPFIDSIEHKHNSFFQGNTMSASFAASLSATNKSTLNTTNPATEPSNLTNGTASLGVKVSNASTALVGGRSVNFSPVIASFGLQLRALCSKNTTVVVTNVLLPEGFGADRQLFRHSTVSSAAAANTSRGNGAPGILPNHVATAPVSVGGDAAVCGTGWTNNAADLYDISVVLRGTIIHTASSTTGASATNITSATNAKPTAGIAACKY